MSEGGGCEATVTARRRCGWVKVREYGELHKRKKLPLKPKGFVYKNYVRSAIL